MTTRPLIFGLLALTTIGCANDTAVDDPSQLGRVGAEQVDGSVGLVNDGEEADGPADDGSTPDEGDVPMGDPTGDAGDAGTEADPINDDEVPEDADALVYPDISEDDVPRMTQNLMQDVLDAGCTVTGVILGDWDEVDEIVEGKILGTDWNTAADFSARLISDETTTTWVGGWTEIDDDELPTGSEPASGLMDGTYDADSAGFDAVLWEDGMAAADIDGYWVRVTETGGFMFGVGSICD